MYVIINEDWNYFSGLNNKGYTTDKDITKAIVFDTLAITKAMLTILDKIDYDNFEIRQVVLKEVDDEED